MEYLRNDSVDLRKASVSWFCWLSVLCNIKRILLRHRGTVKHNWATLHKNSWFLFTKKWKSLQCCFWTARVERVRWVLLIRGTFLNQLQDLQGSFQKIFFTMKCFTQIFSSLMWWYFLKTKVHTNILKSGFLNTCDGVGSISWWS